MDATMKLKQLLLATTLVTATATAFANTDKTPAPVVSEEEVIIATTPESTVSVDEQSTAGSEVAASEIIIEETPKS